MSTDWIEADRISDAIVDVVNAEIARMRDDDMASPFQILAGQLLALLAFLRTAPPTAPQSLVVLTQQVQKVLAEMLGTAGNNESLPS